MSAAITIEQGFEAKAIGAVLEAAVIQVLERFGKSRSLTPIQWSVIDYPEGPVVEGRPVAVCRDAEAICAAWATAMEMTENDWDSVDGERSWRLDIGSWHLELIACQNSVFDEGALHPTGRGELSDAAN